MHRIFIACFLLLCVGCNLKPRYRPPCWDFPVCYRFAQDCEAIDQWANVRWWEQFEDPVLDALIREALFSNQDLQIATARLCEFYAIFEVVRADLFPQVNGQASVERQKISGTSFPTVPAGTPLIGSTYTLALLLSYELDIWGKLRNATEAAYMDFLASTAARRGVILSLVSAVATTYIQLRQYDLQLRISEETLKSRIEYHNLAKLRFEGGLTSAIEVDQAQIEVDSAAAAVEGFKLQIAQSENLLSVLVGENPTCIIRGKSLNEIPSPAIIPAGLPSQLICNRPDILQAEQFLIAANARIGVARARFLPDITLTGLYGYQSSELGSLFSNASKIWQAELSAMQVIFDGGRLFGLLHIAEAQKQEAIHRYILTIQTALKEVEDALIAHKISQEQTKIFEVQVAAAKDYLHLASLQYYEGLTSYLNVIDAQQKLFDAELNWAGAKSDIILSQIAIYKALGGGWVIDADYSFTIDYSR